MAKIILKDPNGDVELSVSGRQLLINGEEAVTRQTVRLEGWTFTLAFFATAAASISAVWPIALHLGWFGLKASGN